MATFNAKVIEHTRVGDQLAVVLDKTSFYPTSGGQPHDTGTINGVPVQDVTIREQDGAILHHLADEIWDDNVQGSIDWARRFDHMQQHTGQHILSAAFEQIARAQTIGFHLGKERCTIDLDTKNLLPGQIERTEDMANEVIFSNHRVQAAIVSREQAANLPLRKTPQVRGPVRIVQVGEFDIAACGGTHVAHTGEIGLIKIIKIESRGKGLRIEFLCGRRALEDYRVKNDILNRLASDLTVGYWDVGQAVGRLRQEIKSLRAELRKADAHLLEYEAAALLHQAVQHGNLRIVSAVFPERDRQEINWLAKNLTEQPGVVALLGVAGSKSHILFARSQEVDRDMVLLLKAALRVLGSTAGGGHSEMAQGGGPPADEKRVEQAISHATRLLLAQKSQA